MKVAVKIHDREFETFYMAKAKLDNLGFNFFKWLSYKEIE